MNKTSRILSLGLVASSLAACNGGSGGTPGIDIGDSKTTSDQKQLIIKFGEAPRDPRIHNLRNGMDEQQDFYPEQDISMTWSMIPYFSDGSGYYDASEEVAYTTTIYLSEDETLQLDQDLELVSINCFLPHSNDYACSDSGSIKSTYAPDNTLTFSSTSTPHFVENSVVDHVVDASEFLDVIPKSVNAIFKACMKDDPANCDQGVVALTLY